MSEQLISRIAKETGITKEQAETTVAIIALYVKEQFPLLQGCVDSILELPQKANFPDHISQ